MDNQNHHGLAAAAGGMSGASAQAAYGMNQYQSNPMMASPQPQAQPQPQSPSQAASGLHPSSTFMREQQYAHQYMHQVQQQELRQQLQNFWANQYHEIEQIVDFKNHSLPLARIKKIMKADEDVRMISAEAPVIFARACEMFILELTLRSWINAEENKRRTLQKNDIAAAITKTDVFDFLVDIVPRDDLKDEMLSPGAIPRVPAATSAVAAENVPYYYMPPQQVVGPPHSPYGPPKVIMGRPVGDQAHYGQPGGGAGHPSFSAQMWPHQQNPSNNNSDS